MPGAFLADKAGAASYEQAQRQAQRWTGAGPNTARPLEFDDTGFPIPQTAPGFVERLTRLLTPC